MDALKQILEPLPYHLALRDYLRSEEPELWGWFASAKAKADYSEQLRMDLLKATYRLDAAGHAEIYQAVEQAKARLQLDIPVTLYQAQNTSQLNAALYFVPGEGHVVFSGPMLTLLNPEEIQAVIAHELAHHHLWTADGGDFHTADRLLQAAANDPRAAASHELSARRFQLYTEIFADRGSLRVAGDIKPVVAALVKTQTGLQHVSADSYLKQSDELLAHGQLSTEGLSHPEAYIRARALALWVEKGKEAAPQIVKLIEGEVSLDGLDLIGQVELARTTRLLIQQLLRPKWFQTPAVLGHARLFFDTFQPPGPDALPEGPKLAPADSKLREYFCYVLLDFATADPELDEMPLAAALESSHALGIEEMFEKVASKELKMKLRDIRKLKERAAEMLSKAEARRE